MGTLDDLALDYPCPACGADVEEWCVTYRPTHRAPGYPAAYLHGPRTYPIGDAFRRGQDEGARTLLGWIDRHQPPDEWLTQRLASIRAGRGLWGR
jgi:hypothetical protein